MRLSFYTAVFSDGGGRYPFSPWQMEDHWNLQHNASGCPGCKPVSAGICSIYACENV